jgi:hypothetical protein
MRPYLTLMFLLCFTCLLAGWGLDITGKIVMAKAFWIAPALFFPILSSIIHYFLLKTTEGKPQQFVTAYIGLLSLKMFVHLVVIVGVAFSFPEYAVQFILLYSGFYLLFTAAETVSLFKVFYKK